MPLLRRTLIGTVSIAAVVALAAAGSAYADGTTPKREDLSSGGGDGGINNHLNVDSSGGGGRSEESGDPGSIPALGHGLSMTVVDSDTDGESGGVTVTEGHLDLGHVSDFSAPWSASGEVYGVIAIPAVGDISYEVAVQKIRAAWGGRPPWLKKLP